jgi:hypothetical protein
MGTASKQPEEKKRVMAKQTVAKREKQKTKPAVKPGPNGTESLAKLAPLSLSEQVEKVLIQGDLSPLTPEQRVSYYKAVCLSCNLNPLTGPFQYILFREPGGNTRLQLYATKSATEQLRKIHCVSVTSSKKEIIGDQCIYEVEVCDRTGRTDSAAGIVPLYKFKDGKRIDFDGVEWANACMKAHTKAKRRATLSIVGLGFIDESELDGVEVVGGVTPEGRMWYKPGQDPATVYAEGREQAKEVAKDKLLEAAKSENPRVRAVAEEGLRKIGREPKEDSGVPAARLGTPTTPVDPSKASPEPPVKQGQSSYDGSVEIDYTDEANPILRGDLANLTVVLEQKCGIKWDGQWWRIEPRKIEALKDVCRDLSFKVTEIMPKSSSPQRHADDGKAEGKGESVPAPPSADAVKGVIDKVRYATVNETVMAHVTVIIDKRKHDYSSWNKTINEELDKAKGKEAVLEVRKHKGYLNIIGIWSVAGVQYEENRPVIQQSQREAGTGKLW